MIRKAEEQDIKAVAAIYEEIHTADECGTLTACWQRGVYPTEDTARKAYVGGELFVGEEGGNIVSAAIINQKQVDVYEYGSWSEKASEEEVMVLHTLVVSPSCAHHGYGRAFVAFYEEYALSCGCRVLRMDTNEKNTAARKLYASLGYREAGIVPATFNGIAGVHLVLLEKIL